MTPKSTGERQERAVEFLGRAAHLDAERALLVVHSAAGSFLAAEAGALVTDIDGNPWTLESDSILAAATPALHEELLALL